MHQYATGLGEDPIQLRETWQSSVVESKLKLVYPSLGEGLAS